MNYKNIYNSLIDRAQGRILTGYFESHHIVPRCMGGDDDKTNLVNLTPEEHFLAHELLVKMYPKEHKLIFALVVMTGKSTTTNKLFGWHRRKLSETQTILKTGVKRGPQSDSHKAAIGAANSGTKNGMWEYEWSDDQKAKLKGRIPWNKGRGGYSLVSQGSFPKGNIPWNKGKKGSIPWNKGLSKKTDARVAKYAETLKDLSKKEVDTQ